MVSLMPKAALLKNSSGVIQPIASVEKKVFIIFLGN